MPLHEREANQNQGTNTQSPPPLICTLPKSSIALSSLFSLLSPLPLPLVLRPSMRIRRRPPGQPLAYLLHSDPPAPQPPRGASGDHQDRPAGDKREEEGLHLHPSAAADLGGDRSSAARRPALLPLLPQVRVLIAPCPDSNLRINSYTREFVRRLLLGKLPCVAPLGMDAQI
jgi:hypothetical protein